MWYAQKCIKGTQTFPISKLGGWKHTTAFHKSTEANRHQTLNHLRQYICSGNRSVIGNRGGRGTLWNNGDIGLSPASWETTQTNKPPKHYAKTGARTSAVLVRTRGNIPNGSEPHKGPSLTKDAWPHSTWRKMWQVSWRLVLKELKENVTSKVSCRATDSLDYLPSKWSESRSAFPTDWSTTFTNERRQWGRLKSGPPLMRRLEETGHS